ncbi:MAG: DUF4254 domain-containing protein [Pirellulales bacterium]|nr:DUF4254 domain-containing protein [Pirellulales bacterium]
MDVKDIIVLQQERTIRWHAEDVVATRDTSLLGIAEQNHLENFKLWHEEDVARCDNLGDQRIVQAKRAIDRHNQQRNDLIEAIDRYFVQSLQPAEEGSPFNSETPGMMIDRLSILALKQYHMREESEREDATSEHRATCCTKLSVIEQQIGHLSAALSRLLNEVRAGTRSFRVYFQFKMYNDQELNPQLRRAA